MGSETDKSINNQYFHQMNTGLEDTMTNENYLAKSTIPINIENMTTILEQMKNCVCKIHTDDGNGSGFFLKILDKIVLMTNFHVLNQKSIKKNRKICFSFYDDKYNSSIFLDNDRRVYFEEKTYDIAIIEIKNTDNIKFRNNKNNYNYLKLDDSINNGGDSECLKNASIYNISYPKNGKACVSYGLVKNINDTEIEHLCSTEKGSSGSPIINLINNKVIGIHKAGHTNNNKGTFLRNPINEFIKNKYNLNDYIQENNNNDTNFKEPENFQNRNEFNINMNNNCNKSYYNENTYNYSKKFNINYNGEFVNNSYNQNYNGNNFYGNYKVDNNPNKINNAKRTNNYPINNKVNENKIKIKLYIKKNDLDKKIYFLDNSDKHNFLKELNEYNTEIFINEEQSKYKKYLKPKTVGVYDIILSLKDKIKDCSNMFYGCQNIINIDLSSFDSSSVTNMSNMFKDCNNLTNVNLSCLNTSNVINMEKMFCNCSNLNNIDLSSFQTAKVINMHEMFYGCKNVSKINLLSFNCINVIDTKLMFTGCNNLKEANTYDQRILNEFYKINVI